MLPVSTTTAATAAHAAKEVWTRGEKEERQSRAERPHPGVTTNWLRRRVAHMSFARHGTMANLESTLALRQAQFVTSQPGVTTHEDDDLQYMRSSFHSVRDSLLGASRPAAAATFGAASGQRRSPPKAADRVPDYSIAHPVSRPARELGLLVHPDQVPIPCTHTAVLMRVHTPHMHVHCTCIAHDQHAHRVFPVHM